MIENHVCLLELAKKLKELGVKQDSEFYWIQFKTFEEIISKEDLEYYPSNINSYSAFLASELGEIMSKISVLDRGYQQSIELSIHGCGFLPEDDDFSKNIIFEDDSEPNMRAKMLIYLIEEGYVKVEDINK